MANTELPAENRFNIVSRIPSSGRKNKRLAEHTVNALAIALGISWEESAKKLLVQVHKYCQMPDDMHCIRGTLKDSGFVRLKSPTAVMTVDAFCRDLHRTYTDGEIVILTSTVRCYGSYAAALLPGPDGIYRIYSSADCRAMQVKNIWVRRKDGPEQAGFSGIRAGCINERKPPASHGCFRYTMQNPAGKYIGDCVIRGLSSAMNMNWHDVMDGLMECCSFARLDVNCKDVYEKFLSDNGFVRHNALRKGNRALKGDDFCEEIPSVCRHGERIFAMSGRSHAVAIMPERKNGRTCYFIEDTWDSSGRTIGEFWISPRKDRLSLTSREKTDVSGIFSPGQVILHPVFDQGRIISVSEKYSPTLLVEFEDYGVRRLSASWVNVHCIVQGA